MKTKDMYLLSCDYGEWDDTRSIPFLIVETPALALSISKEIMSDSGSQYRQIALKALGERALPPDADISVQAIPMVETENPIQKLLTKDELELKLAEGSAMVDLFDFGPGQECEIFKAEKFSAGPQILYIPDVTLNQIPISEPVSDSRQQIEDILSQCYTGDDFIEECGGDAELAERLFHYCDWQHPSSALPELKGED